MNLSIFKTLGKKIRTALGKTLMDRRHQSATIPSGNHFTLEVSIMTVEERLSRLEQANRRWRLAATGLAACLVLVVSVGAATKPQDARFGTVTAETFILKDRSDNSVGFLATNEDFEPYLSLHDPDGPATATLAISDAGASMMATNGVYQVMVGASGDGAASFLMGNKKTRQFGGIVSNLAGGVATVGLTAPARR
ncbi:hypothetical protein Pan216_16080 [Planctomycetes bacterium Pan216]|uniref:Uncharacterized protein n=1 Tax=Kolteria novifilia TaxID=2527975 RepID=A0A518B1B9_9BACT|nr:hypothetical protein Pan216_16080 [Planctomycetes bacterium Pan216]